MAASHLTNRDTTMRHLRAFTVIAALFLTLLPQMALAHAQLGSTNPNDGAVVEAMPEAITLNFSEEISPLVLRWVAPDGETTDATGGANGSVLSVEPPTSGGNGTYILSWRIVSGDGHPVGGALTFHLGAPSVQSAEVSETSPAAAATAAFRFLVSLTLVGGVGTAIFAALIARATPTPWLRRFGLTASLATLPLAALFLGFHGLDLTALRTTDLLTAAPWTAAMASPVTRTVALSILAAIAAAAALSGTRLRVPLALLSWGLAALSYAASGHAVTAPPQGLSTSAVLVHATAMIYWTGALVPLLVSLRDEGAAIRLQRFSTIAIGMVLLLVLSGAVLIWVQAGNPVALLASTYGKVLGAKLALVAALLALAAVNRLRLTPALAAGRDGAEEAMTRSIRAEIVLAVLILLFAALFRLTPPPRALMVEAEPAYVHIHSTKVMADVVLTPPRTGPVTVAIGIQSGDFTELVPRAVDVAFTSSTGDIEPIHTSAQLGDDGLWHAGPVTLPFAGDWEVTLRVLITDFESATIAGAVTIGR